MREIERERGREIGKERKRMNNSKTGKNISKRKSIENTSIQFLILT